MYLVDCWVIRLTRADCLFNVYFMAPWIKYRTGLVGSY